MIRANKTLLLGFTERGFMWPFFPSKTPPRNAKERTLTNLSRIFVVTRPLDKHQQFVPRRLETFG